MLRGSKNFLVLILDDKSEIVAHVLGNLCYLIFLRQLIETSKKSLKNNIFPHACAACSELSYDISTSELDDNLPDAVCQEQGCGSGSRLSGSDPQKNYCQTTANY